MVVCHHSLHAPWTEEMLVLLSNMTPEGTDLIKHFLSPKLLFASPGYVALNRSPRDRLTSQARAAWPCHISLKTCHTTTAFAWHLLCLPAEEKHLTNAFKHNEHFGTLGLRE